MSNLRMGRLQETAVLTPPGSAGPFSGPLAVSAGDPRRQSAVQTLQVRRDVPEAFDSRRPDPATQQPQLPMVSGAMPTANTVHQVAEFKAPPDALPANAPEIMENEAIRRQGLFQQPTHGQIGPPLEQGAIPPGAFYERAVSELLGPERAAHRLEAYRRAGGGRG